jgi:predicted SprT family Zn-dependent metalloprotease
MDLLKCKTLVCELMDKHGLKPQWGFRYFGSRISFGRCNYVKKEILLSSELVSLNSEELVKDTILHEIAHALTKGSHHNWKWKKKCTEIGCSPVRTYNCEYVKIGKAPYKGKCKCSTPHSRYKRPSSIYRCRDCGATINWERTK